MNDCRQDDATCEIVYIDESLTKAMADSKDPLHEKIMDAVQIFHWQLRNDVFKLTQDPFEKITYYIHHWNQDTTNDMNYILSKDTSVWNRGYCVFDSDEDFEYAMALAKRDKPYTWAWKYSDSASGYEVTSKGDRRYSPFFQKMRVDNELITLEDYFKKYMKPYYDKGLTPPIRGHKLMYDYMMEHKGLLFELAIIGRRGNFTDMFDRDGGQNKWYAEMLNQYYGFK